MKVLLFCLGSLLSLTTFAQNANPDRKRTRHWVFGEKNWIEWTDTGALQHPGSKAIQTEQMAVFTDTAGNLQLYFDSKNIYDSEHNVIANGAITDGFWSFHRGAIFVPYPKSDSLCYLFYTMYASGKTFGYALINYKTKTVLKKQALLNSPVIEGVSASLHHNGNYYWVSGALAYSDYLFFFLITDQGILPCPFLQPNLSSYKSSSGQCGLSFSLSNKKLVNYDLDINRMQIADFNSFNSKLSDSYLKYTPGGGLQCGAEFSENDSFLYTQIIAYDGFRQYRLSDWSSIVIDSNSKFPVKYSFGLSYLNNSHLVTGYYGSQNTKDTNAMFLLNNTNQLYKSGNLNTNWLKTTNRIKYAPPNFPYNFHRKYRSDFSYLTNCGHGLLELKAITTGTEISVYWQIISPKNKTINVTSNYYSVKVADSGIWKVRMIANYSSESDTIVKYISIFAPFPNYILGPDIPVCKDTFSLKLTIPKNAICSKWENLISSNLRSIDTFGTYSVQFYDSNYCYYTDTVLVYKTDTLIKPKIQFTSKDSLQITNYKKTTGVQFVFTNNLQSDTSLFPNHKVNDTGLWKVQIISNWGCKSATDSIFIAALGSSIPNYLNYNIYPNPVNNKIYIKPEKYISYSIVDVHGRMLLNGKGAEIDISLLPPAVYSLQIISNTQATQIIKFIKL